MRQAEQPSPDSKQTPPVLVVRHLPGGNKGRCMVAWSVGALHGRQLGCGLEALDKKGKLAPSKGLRSGQINVVQTTTLTTATAAVVGHAVTPGAATPTAQPHHNRRGTQPLGTWLLWPGGAEPPSPPATYHAVYSFKTRSES